MVRVKGNAGNLYLSTDGVHLKCPPVLDDEISYSFSGFYDAEPSNAVGDIFVPPPTRVKIHFWVPAGPLAHLWSFLARLWERYGVGDFPLPRIGRWQKRVFSGMVSDVRRGEDEEGCEMVTFMVQREGA